jgi:hypothetical protein
MSAPTDIYVSPSTSLILIRNVSTPTNIYLTNFNVPNFNLSIRDTTGSPTIGVSSVYISTVGSSRFADGSFLYTLNQPLGFVNLGFRNSSFWQVLHTSGQTPNDSAANVTQLNVSTSFISLLSTTAITISSLLIENIRTTNAITITGPFVITNLSAPGIITVQSSLNVYGDVTIDKQFFVSGATQFQSSLQVTEILPISSITRVFSSVGVGGTLSVGGILTVGSTLFTRSTNILQSLQVQKSSQSITTTVEDTLQVQNVLSSLLSLTVMSNYVGFNNSLTIEQTTSTLGGTFSTQTMAIGDDLFTKGAISTGDAAFLSTVSFGSSMTVSGNVFVSTGFMAGGDMNTSVFDYLTTPGAFITPSSFSTGSLSVQNTFSISSGISTFFVDVLDRLSIGTTVHTVATVSSYNETRVKDQIYVGGNAFFDTLYFSSGISSKTLFVKDEITTSSSRFQNLITAGSLFTDLPVTVFGIVNVFSTVRVENNVLIEGISVISSINAPSYLLSSLFITTSSPNVAFTASTLVVSCNVETQTVLINDTEPLVTETTFASTTQFFYTDATNIVVKDAVTSNLFWGDPFSELEDVSFSVTTPSLFPKGLSAQTIIADAITSKKLIGNFEGDAFGISNVALPFKNISAAISYASTVSSHVVYTSSFQTSTFQNSFLTTLISSFESPDLAIESVGFPFRSDKNQILMVTSTVYAINNTLFIDAAQRRVGINISSPQADLDISGGLYAAGGLFFSSQKDIYVSTSISPLNISTFITASAFIRDSFTIGTNTQLQNPNFYSNGFALDPVAIPPFVVGVAQTLAPVVPSILARESTISLQNTVFITANTKRVGVNSISYDFFSGSNSNGFINSNSNSNGSISADFTFRDPSYEFQMKRDMIVDGVAYMSSLSLNTILTKTATLPSFYIQANPSFSTNTFSTTFGTLYMNDNLLVLSNAFQKKIGINTTSMVSFGSCNVLDINGSAFFSTASIKQLNTIETLSFSSRVL